MIDIKEKEVNYIYIQLASPDNSVQFSFSGIGEAFDYAIVRFDSIIGKVKSTNRGLKIKVPDCFELSKEIKENFISFFEEITELSPSLKLMNKAKAFISSTEIGTKITVLMAEKPFDAPENFNSQYKAFRKNHRRLANHRSIRKFLNQYTVISHVGNKKIKIGESSKSNRICRFCGRGVNKGVTFNSQAHAISESIGNKKYILHEECDECNDYFSRTIELDILEMFRLEIQAFKIKGKKRRVPKIKKEKWGIVYHSSDTPDSQIKIYTGENSIPSGKSQVPYGEFIPQNVYKALAKYAISMVKKEYLPTFKRTIAWLKDESNFKNELPEILIAYTKQDSFNFYVFEHKYGYVGHLITKGFAIVFQIPTFDTKNTAVNLKKYFRLRQQSISENIESIYVQDISENRPVIGTLTVSNER